MRAERRPSLTPARVDPDVAEKRAAFAELWNRGVTLPTLRRRFGFHSDQGASNYAVSLRRAGYELERRKGRNGGRQRSGPTVDQRRAALTLVPAEIAPAIILDAEGRPIATMDPVTRQRSPIIGAPS